MQQSYNWRYLSGMRHITDVVYQERLAEEGIEIPDEDLHTVRVNKHYIEQNPEENLPFLKKKLAENGLKYEETN